MQEIAQRQDRRSIEPFMHLVVKHARVKQTVSDAIFEIVSTVHKLLMSNHDLMVNASSNELLVAALRIEDIEVVEAVIEESVAQSIFQATRR